MKILREVLLGWNEDYSIYYIQHIMEDGTSRYSMNETAGKRGKLIKNEPYVARSNPALKRNQ